MEEAGPGSTSALASPAPRVRVLYSCRKCRATLCRGEQVEAHEPARHTFSYHRTKKELCAAGASAGTSASAGAGAGAAAGGPADDVADDSAAASACTSLFLAEALKWMQSASVDIEGKLACYDCGARVGALRWAGGQCSCGTWVTPAIQLYKKTLDSREEVVDDTEPSAPVSQR